MNLKDHHHNSYKALFDFLVYPFAIFCQISKGLSILRKMTTSEMGNSDNNLIDWICVITTCNSITKPPVNLRMRPKHYNLISDQKTLLIHGKWIKTLGF